MTKSNQSTRPLLELHNVCFSYNRNQLLHNINLVVNDGEFCGLIGPNGSGKSTLMKLILGFLPLNHGEILIHGHLQENKVLKEHIAYVPQNSNDFNASFPATVEEVVRANLYREIGMFRPTLRVHREKVRQALALVDMSGFEKRLIGELSGGQMQRVLIARALVADPCAVFLDEPTAGVDLKSENEIYQLLKKLQKQQHLSLFLISHDINAVFNLCDRVLCLGVNGFFETTYEEYSLHTDKFFKKLYGDMSNFDRDIKHKAVSDTL